MLKGEVQHLLTDCRYRNTYICTYSANPHVYIVQEAGQCTPLNGTGLL